MQFLFLVAYCRVILVVALRIVNIVCGMLCSMLTLLLINNITYRKATNAAKNYVNDTSNTTRNKNCTRYFIFNISCTRYKVIRLGRLCKADTCMPIFRSVTLSLIRLRTRKHF